MDGSIEITFTDDTSAKMAAVGFHVIEVYDGTNDVRLPIFPTSCLSPDRDNLLAYCHRRCPGRSEDD